MIEQIEDVNEYRCSRCGADDISECTCYTIDKHLDELLEDGWITNEDLE